MIIKDDVQLKESLASLKTSIETFKEAKGQPEPDMFRKMCGEIYDSLYAATNYLHDRIDRTNADVAGWKADHNKGHLPPMKTPSQMDKALKVLGLQDDFQVARPTISVAHSRVGSTAFIQYIKPISTNK